MKAKREIYALDYAIAEFVSALNSLLYPVVEDGTKLIIAGGLRVEVEKVSDYEVRVSVHPTNWPTDGQIYARFETLGRSPWRAFEGYLTRADHLAPEFRQLSFGCSWEPSTLYKFWGKGTDDQKAIQKLYSFRAATTR